MVCDHTVQGQVVSLPCANKFRISTSYYVSTNGVIIDLCVEEITYVSPRNEFRLQKLLLKPRETGSALT
jgi:hypothetical protein